MYFENLAAVKNCSKKSANCTQVFVEKWDQTTCSHAEGRIVGLGVLVV